MGQRSERRLSASATVCAAMAVLASCPHAAADALDIHEERVYKYFSYSETFRVFDDLKARCPDIVDTVIAQDEFPGIIPDGNKAWATCEGQPCKTLLVRITNRAKLTPSTPEVFFSGALHGDERIGPLVVTEMARLLCDGYLAGDEDIRRLVDGRSVWIAPMTNAEGFANRHREENGMDPNRDFPYLQQADRCMMTQTARAVNELFRRHLFHFMMTFHGGMRALTYEWGSLNHMESRRSTESPDDHAFAAFGKLIQDASGRDRRHRMFYPLGRINDMVYPVDGGMEDWSYAAGWEESPKPISVCRPRTYGGYASSRTVYKKGSVACLVYLAEMDDLKTPPASTLGRAAELWSPSDTDGHVARNLRMSLKMVELARPEVVVARAASWPVGAIQAGAPLEVRVRGFGCITMSARLLLIAREHLKAADCSMEQLGSAERARALQLASKVAEASSVKCGGLAIWEKPALAELSLEGSAPPFPSGEFCAVIAAEFDQDWAQQTHPDPGMKPQSHAVRSRVDDHYVVEASDGEMRISEYRTKLFPVSLAPIAFGKAGDAPATGVATANVSEIVGQSAGARASEPAVVAAPDAREAPRLPTSLANADAGGLPGVLLAMFSMLVVILVLCNAVALYRRCHSASTRPRWSPVRRRSVEPEASSSMEQGAVRAAPGPAE